MSVIESNPNSLASPSAKDMVRKILDNLPDNCTLEQIRYHVNVLRGIEIGTEQIDAGEGIPREEAKKRFSQWLTE